MRGVWLAVQPIAVTPRSRQGKASSLRRGLSAWRSPGGGLEAAQCRGQTAGRPSVNTLAGVLVSVPLGAVGAAAERLRLPGRWERRLGEGGGRPRLSRQTTASLCQQAAERFDSFRFVRRDFEVGAGLTDRKRTPRRRGTHNIDGTVANRRVKLVVNGCIHS